MLPSYVHGAATTPLLGQTIGAALDDAGARCRDRDALISCHQNLRYTYEQLLDAVDRTARALLALRIRRGDRIGIWSSNVAEWVITQYAAAKIGAILVNINPAYRLRELEYVLKRSGISVLITARGFRKTDYLPILAELAPELDGACRGPLAIKTLPQLRHIVYLGEGVAPGGMTWDELTQLAGQVPVDDLLRRQETLQFDDPANIQYTSGTTGLPKGATLSHHNILNNGFFVGEGLRYTPDDRICVTVPFYHCFGCVLANLAALTHGAAIVLPAETFDPEATLLAIEAQRCTSIYGVPTMFIGMLEHPLIDRVRLESLRTGIMAGSPCPVEVMRQVIERMHVREVTICYGMTETSPVSFQSAVEDPIEIRVSTVGRIHPHLECKIVNPDSGEIVPRGAQGELCTRGYSVMLGYWEDAEATREVIDEARWMHTGDLGVMREDGCVNITGRLKDVIIRGGENVYPRQIEDFLYSHPKVSEVQVVGVPDVRYGEAVCAWVRLRAGECATEEEIRSFCRGQIATHNIPRYIRFTEEFPTTVTGKVQKYRMREISILELGLSSAESTPTA